MKASRSTSFSLKQSKPLSDDDYLLIYGNPISSIRNTFIKSSSQANALNQPYQRRPSSHHLILRSKTLLAYKNECEAKELRKKHSKFIVKSSSNLLFLFNILKGLLIIFSVTSSLYYLAFGQDETELFIDRIIWSFFAFDFFLQFFTEKRDKKKRKLLNFRLIFKKYLSTWLIPDLLALIPYSWFQNPNIEFSFRLIRILKMNYLSSLVNIKLISKVVAKVFNSGKLNRQKQIVYSMHYVWDLISKILLLVFFSYLLAALWLYYIEFIIRKFDPSTDFIEYFNMENDSSITKMIKVWYFIFSTLTTSGFGDFSSVNNYERIINTIIIIFGPTWYAYTLSKIFKILDSIYNSTRNSNKSAELALWISSTESKHRRIKSKLKTKINDFFLYYWKNDRLDSMHNIVSEACDSSEILKSKHVFIGKLPNDLKFEICEYLFGDVFRNFSFFFGRDSEWKYRFTLYMQPRVYLTGVGIVKIGEVVQELFFVDKGVFDVKAMVGSGLKLVQVIRDRWIIGDYFILKEIEAFFEYTALSTVHGFGVPGFVFKALAKDACDEFRDYEIALNRYFMDTCKQIFENNLGSDIFMKQPNSPERLHPETQDFVGLEQIANNMKAFRKQTMQEMKEKLLKLILV